MKYVYQFTLLVGISLFLPYNLFAQKFKEDFSKNHIYDWYVRNTSSPQPAAEADWQFGTWEPRAGAEYGSSNLGTFIFNMGGGSAHMYRYASVGYTESDYDGAHLGKWFITPVLFNLKNGDQFRFITRAQPELTDYERALLLAQYDATSILSCNRPNRLEVRLNTHYEREDYPFDSINVGRFPHENGHFDKLLLTINESLTLEGYPQSWTVYTVTISGLPENEVHHGRIGFKYDIPNAGYNKCQNTNPLPPPVSFGLDAAANAIEAVDIGKPIAYAKFAYDVFSTALSDQKGKNGTYIGIDDLKLTTGVSIVDVRSDEKGKRYYWNKGNSQNGKYIHLGYQGKPGACSADDYPYDDVRYFYIENGSEQTVVVNPNVTPIWGSTEEAVYLEYDPLKTSIPPGGNIYLRAKLKAGITYKSYYNAIQLKSNTGELLAQINVQAHIDPPNPPLAVCRESSVSVKLDQYGVPLEPLNLKEFDAGSLNSCRFPTDLAFQLLDENKYPINNISCANLGLRDVFLKVTDTTTNVSSQCAAKLDVYNLTKPTMESGVVQKVYLSFNTPNVPLDSLKAPAIIAGCSAGPPTLTSIAQHTNYGSGSIDVGKPNALGIGKYTVGWVATDQAGNSGYQKTIVEVIDTVPPRAFCNDTSKIGFTSYLNGVGIYYKDKILGKEDIDRKQVTYLHEIPLPGDSYDNTLEDKTNRLNRKIYKYLLSTPWKGYTEFRDNIPFSCADAGAEFPLTMRVEDVSGNFATCQTIVKIKDPDQATCKNISVMLDPENGYKIIEAKDVLEGAGDGICGISNTTVFPNQLSCTDVNKTVPVEVTYLDASAIEHSCTALVNVKAFSEPIQCEDTVTVFIPYYRLKGSLDLGPVVSSVCSEEISWNTISSGATPFNENHTGSYLKDFNPGISSLTRTTIYETDTFTCKQIVMVLDTIKPVITSTPSNQTIQLPRLTTCTYSHEIVNPFMQESYTRWSYTLSGANNGSKTFKYNTYYYDEEGNSHLYYENQWVNLLPGLTKITLQAWDLVGNMSEVSYDFNLTVQNMTAPYVSSAEFDALPNNTLKGDFCGEEYLFHIESPVQTACPEDDFMWYFEVRDNFNGNIIYEEDSIPQSSGAYIPLKVGPKYNQTYYNYVYFGYHEKTYGSKTYSSNKIVVVTDTLINKIECPGNLVVENTNGTDFTYDYMVPSPILNACEGSFWGFSVSGATNYKTTDQSVSYNSNQQIALGMEDLSNRYPSLAYNESPTIALNPGINRITYRVLEQSGNVSTYINECTYKVEVRDISQPVMVCPPDDTLRRSTLGPCAVTVGGPCQQIAGFTKGYGINELGLSGGNSSVTMDYSTLPDSISFINNVSVFSSADSYITLIAKCDGTISFTWEYQCTEPNFFRPFINYNNFAPSLYSQASISGFNAISNAKQTGTYSQAVSKGEYVIIGVTEGGKTGGYFKIKNFSGPYFDAGLDIAQPTFTQSQYLSAYSNIQTEYPIGTHEIVYNLLNLNNGNTAQCVQNLSVIDDFATTLSCSNQTLYLSNGGIAILDPEDVISTCFDVSNTTISKDTFNFSDLGTQTVSITSIDQSNNTHTCSFDVTVIDTISPVVNSTKLSVNLNNSNSATIDQSMLRSLVYDNHGVETISISQSSFSCNDIGEKTLILTATDSSGNSSSAQIYVSVYPDGFDLDEQDKTIELCVGENRQICTSAGSVNNQLEFYWQTKQTVDSLKTLNNLAILPKNSNKHHFFKLKIGANYEKDYLAYPYSDGSDYGINFKLHDPDKNTMVAALKPLIIPGYLGGNFFMDAFQDGSIYVVAYDNNYGIKMYRYQGGNWAQINETIFYTQNMDFQNFYENDGYFFSVKWNGTVYAAKEYYTGTSQMTDMHVETDGYASSTYVSNANNIVGLRNSFNQNYFYRLNLNPNSMEGGGAFLPNGFGPKDALTDPTGNSDLFDLKSYKDQAYIAYKTASGKISVKKFDGTSNWTLVGSADFSEKQASRLDFDVVNDTLYVAYIGTNDTLYLHKWTGSNWAKAGSGKITKDNTIQIVDLNDEPAIHIKSLVNGLYVIDGWAYNGKSGNCFTAATDNESDQEFRAVITKSGCATQTSGIKRVIVKDYPSVSVSDASVVDFGSVTLKATKDFGTINWLNSQNNVVSTEQEYETPVLFEDTQYKVFASNGVCNSDTAISHVYVNSDTIHDISLIFKDSLCKYEYTLVEIENPQPGYKYMLYEEGENGFVPKQGPYVSGPFNIRPQETGTYKIKAIEPVTDASLITYGQDYIQFIQPALNISNQVTIEAYVKLDDITPEYVLGHLFGTYTQSTYNISWEWGKYFKVYYEGGGLETLVFPNLPLSQPGTWIHVATTAGPDGMAIYYDGVLVASKSISRSENIRASAGNLYFGVLGTNNYNNNVGQKSYGLGGIDEVRVWNTRRNASEIKNNYTACIQGTEAGLMLYNKFNNYDSGTKTFGSEKGTDATVINPSYATTSFRTGECFSRNFNERFFEPFTINMLTEESTVDELLEYYETEAYACGGEVVEVYGKSYTGSITWYSDYEGGEVIGTGDTLRKLFDRDTIIYAGASEKCERWEVEIDIQEQPRVISVSTDSICAGSYLDDAYIYVDLNYDATDFELYDAPVGGNLVDPYDTDTPIMVSDTLYAEAYYEDYDYDIGEYVKICSSATRTPVYINVHRALNFTSIPSDTTICGPGTVTMKATAEYGMFEWYYVYNPPLGRNVGRDSVVSFDVTETGLYKVGLYYDTDNETCYSEYEFFTITLEDNMLAYDTVLTCSPYTWIDGNTYSTSNPDIMYVKPNEGACDSIYHLNLVVDDLSDNLVSASKYSACVGGSSVISVSNSNASTQYTMIDISDNSVVDGPKAGNGGTLTFSTGALTDTITFRILTESSLVSGTKSLSCNNQLAQDITINVGTKSSVRTVVRCGSYLWNGTTYTESGVYYKTLTSSEGCDSIAQLNLTINSAVQYNETVTACDSYTWHGVTYTASTNTPTWTGKTAQGCDSVVTLNLTIKQSTASEFTASSCGDYTWNSTTYSQSGNYIQTLSNAAGCDSVVTLHLTVKQPSAFTQIFEECPGYSVKVGSKTYTSTGIYTDVLTNSVGCDSLVTTNLTIKEVNTNTSVAGTTIIAEASPATYQWIDCNNGNQILTGETSQSLDVPSFGSYAVVVTQNGCSDTSLCESVVITDAGDVEESIIFKVYPSPAQDRIQVELPETKISSLTIADAVGVIVYAQQKSLGKKHISIAVDDFASGIYFVYIETETGTEVRKFFKE